MEHLEGLQDTFPVQRISPAAARVPQLLQTLSDPAICQITHCKPGHAQKAHVPDQASAAECAKSLQGQDSCRFGLVFLRHLFDFNFTAHYLLELVVNHKVFNN